MQQHREQLILAGVAQLATEGVQLGLPHVHLDELAADLAISRRDAVAAWGPGDDYADAEQQLRLAIALRVLQEQPGVGDNGISEGGLSDTAEAVTAVISAMPDLDGLDPAERADWLRRVIRAGTITNHTMADRSQLWQAYVTILSGLLSQRPMNPVLENAWRSSETGGAGRYMNLYMAMAQIFGMRLRYCYTWEQFATAVIVISEGLMLRANAVEHVRHVERATGPNGETEDWNLFGVCLEALVRQFFEPDGESNDLQLDHEDRARALLS